MSEDHGFKSSWTTERDAVSKNKIMADHMSLVEHLLSIRGLDSILITEEKSTYICVFVCVCVSFSYCIICVYRKVQGNNVCQIGKYSVNLSSLSKG